MGAVAAAGLVVSWAQIVRISNDDRLERYSGDVAAYNQLELAEARSEAREPKLFDDYCVPASGGIPYTFFNDPAKFQEVQGLCDAADTWELLQYVFLGTAVAAGGTGVVLLLTSGSGHSHSANEAPRFALTPQLSPDRAHFTATLRF